MALPETYKDFPEPDDDAALAAEIAGVRLPVRAYAFSLLGDHAASDEVAQDVCLFLWERRAERRSQSDLKAWAFGVARFKALAWRRDQARRSTVHFSDDILLQIEAGAAEVCSHLDERLKALRACLGRVAPDDLRLLQSKYANRASLTAQARDLGVPPNRLQKTISRLRLALRHCIETTLSRQP
ncbi:MAG: sigma-70 family RNA polymerase sigma factor [Verrucomicrobia bacterium]|nr:sigma-70 family RNA polymerase sigma factor [Verrucomicrobiota bacterium]